MPKGKHWSAQEEADLKTLVETDIPLEQIAAKLGKTPGAIIIKCKRLGLRIDTKGYVDSSVAIPRECPSMEESLCMMAGALKGALKPGLDKIEVQRLTAVSNMARTYSEFLDRFVNYRGIENKLQEMEKRVEELSAQLQKERSSKVSCQRDSASVE